MGDTLKFNLHIIECAKKGCEFNQKRCELKNFHCLLPKLCLFSSVIIPNCLLAKVVFFFVFPCECFHNLVDGNWLMGVESHTFLGTYSPAAAAAALATRSDDR